MFFNLLLPEAASRSVNGGPVSSRDTVKQNEMKDRVLRDGFVNKCMMFSYLLIRQIITAYIRLPGHPP